VDGRQRERSFATANEAKDYKIKVDHDTRAKIFVDDRAGREKFADAASARIDRSANSAGEGETPVSLRSRGPGDCCG
jgi:hypothetical protein